ALQHRLYNDGLESVEVSKGHRVYWKDTRTVTVERGVIFRKEEGGIRGFIEVEEEGVEVGIEGEGSTNNPNNPANAHIANSPTSPETPRSKSLEPVRQPRVRKPSQYVQRLLDGTGTTGTGDTVPRGIILPNETVFSLIPEGTTEEQAFLADVSETEGLEPRTVTEAQRRSDWPKSALAARIMYQTRYIMYF
ncbi:hypothetical protein BT96DRAFT_990329, partial [Gymnopus androsaceus JB14]